MANTLSRVYVPGNRWDWESRDPASLGLDAATLQDAIDFHYAHGTANTPNAREVLTEVTGWQGVHPTGDEPLSATIGAVKRRGPENGLIIRHGYIAAQWGNVRQIDMTYSVAKSYLSTMAGLAVDHGLIADVDDKVGDYVSEPGLFDSEHNAQITWKHLLQQTSEWEGILWEKPDWSDRPEEPEGHWHERKLVTPGTKYKYNDVRVNLLALCLLHVWRRPLPQVLREYIMDPAGASPTWRWNGYFNSWITLDGMRVQSVSGGSHWGGGLWINSLDHARFGLLHLRNGQWGDQQLLSEEWIRAATTPSEMNPNYGYMWWLNPDQSMYPHGPGTGFAARGQGANMVWIDPENDIVAIARWIDHDHFDGFVERLVAAVKD